MSSPKTTGARGPYAKSAQRSSDILDAAATVFGTHGYHGGSLRDIARQLDVSLTSVVHHFGSKYELLEAVLERSDGTTDGNQAFDFDAACVDRGVVPATLERIRSSVKRPELLRLFAILAAESSAPGHPAHDWFVARYQRKASELANAFTYDQTSGRIDAARDPQALGRLLLAVWDGVQLQWLIDPSTDMEKAMLLFFESALPEALNHPRAVVRRELPTSPRTPAGNDA
ncbi:TetR/AcrR family transcriptional regulator [Microbacterium sp. EYE_5]|uniref:TetR/AcrR family transcriptional regulator n=1 Tax=unclassified Microbacterium TaxID=2609290 RepID=UPI0020056B01|nr:MULTISPECIES: TetR/AcrR family transcriptional regulator [unclassified Microbacterium]MCK6079401.1 TetR/AcrR family transcriptional regulator [Microbacterium sp. EYE_382]MCK6084671.1 TetR/AcrR family transcriptional regulator [Microbacterium sp. EYE_384]MCK6123100.1 TetR/AcrR family transcriptional regulator [Microbacterium sp. EYE_80]MCK6125435.1 TetR/AcrR family transcriptional regulator [Microbacterium sp. EYE_79]MCK6140355.1 TetR/AcrR family transcriptional regulator [Microbacterium sp.